MNINNNYSSNPNFGKFFSPNDAARRAIKSKIASGKIDGAEVNALEPLGHFFNRSGYLDFKFEDSGRGVIVDKFHNDQFYPSEVVGVEIDNSAPNVINLLDKGKTIVKKLFFANEGFARARLAEELQYGVSIQGDSFMKANTIGQALESSIRSEQLAKQAPEQVAANFDAILGSIEKREQDEVLKGIYTRQLAVEKNADK